jgi:release factor glutamine methyltransferase
LSGDEASQPAADVAALLREGRQLLAVAVAVADAGPDVAAPRNPADAAHEASLLLGHALQRNGAWLIAHGDARPAGEAVAHYRRLLAARAAGTPVAHLLGRRGFWTLDLEVDASTLVPRPETERLVELALARLPVDAVAEVLDLGTGSGAIALAIASERPRARVTGTDASVAALAVARRNAAAHAIGNVDWRHGDWFAAVADRRFAVVVGNPPYIADSDPHLARGDLRFEPRTALASGADGLDAIRTIVAAAPAHLQAAGWLLLEHGWQQGDAVRGLFTAAGLVEVGTEQDLEARDRVTLGRLA